MRLPVHICVRSIWYIGVLLRVMYTKVYTGLGVVYMGLGGWLN